MVVLQSVVESFYNSWILLRYAHSSSIGQRDSPTIIQTIYRAAVIGILAPATSLLGKFRSC